MKSQFVKALILVHFLLFYHYRYFAFERNAYLDSLITLTNSDATDTQKLNVYIKLASTLLNNNNKQSLEYGKKAFKIARSINSKKGMSDALNGLGNVYYALGEFVYAKSCFENAQLIAEKENFKLVLANAYSGLGLVYLTQSLYPKALEYFFNALRINEEINNDQGILNNMGNIGIVYNEEKNYTKAIEYYTNVLVMAESTGNTRLKMNQYTNIGTAYAEQSTNTKGLAEKNSMLQKALDFYEKALASATEVKEKNTEALVLLNMASLFSEKYNLTTNPKERKELKENALKYFFLMIDVSKELGNKYYEAITVGNLGSLYLNSGEYLKAEQYLKKALVISNELNALSLLRDQEQYLYLLYDTTKQYKLALKHYKNFISLRDRILNEENSQKSMLQQMQYDFDKKDALAKEENKRKIEILKEKGKRQTIFIYASVGGLLFLTVIAFLVFKNLKISRSQNKIIRAKNKDILDSITYAKRIQEAILPSNKTIQEFLTNYFILYKPKDIVAGDFYWIEKLNQRIYIAAADCTGHGVPGAMVSVVCSNALSKALLEEKNENPGDLLFRTREIVVEKLSKNNEDVLDGMDISLASILINEHNESENRKIVLEWAGANNPLWVIRNKNKDLLEIKPNKQPIGKVDNPLPFITHTIELQKGDSIYLFTDGLQDQFGGEKGKKFKSSKLKSLLLSIQNQTMDEQKELIDTSFETWKGKLEQIDDVCIIGIKI
ncbi:MAG: tetratricopeptide repeat protein [Flavobacteriales bacterium]|nr:tetratricopeptide repeat protein [Flavobacteriales bacterium]